MNGKNEQKESGLQAMTQINTKLENICRRMLEIRKQQAELEQELHTLAQQAQLCGSIISKL